MSPGQRNGPAGNGTGSDSQQTAGQAPPSVTAAPDNREHRRAVLLLVSAVLLIAALLAVALLAEVNPASLILGVPK